MLKKPSFTILAFTSQFFPLQKRRVSMLESCSLRTKCLSDYGLNKLPVVSRIVVIISVHAPSLFCVQNKTQGMDANFTQ